MKDYKRNIARIGRFGLISALLLIAALSLSACSSGGGSSRNQTSSSSGGAYYDMAAPAPAPAAPSYAPSPDVYSYDRAEESEVYYSDDAGAGGFAGTEGSVQSGRKITFRASMSINTKKYDADYAAIVNLVRQSDGYVASESTSDYSSYGYNEGRRSYFSVRIPAVGYDSFLDRLSEIGDVIDKNKSSDDLTSQYFDTEARIEMLELRKERLMAYLVEAENAADIVEFERELSNVLYELDQYQGYKRQLDQLVDFATVDITLLELITPETIGKDGEPLGERASEAFSLSTYNVGRFLQGVAVFFAGAAPVIALLVVIALIVWVIVRVTRPLREKGREKREAREEERLARKAEQQALRMRQYPAPQPYGQAPYAQQAYMTAPVQPAAPQPAAPAVPAQPSVPPQPDKSEPVPPEPPEEPADSGSEPEPSKPGKK